MPDRFAGTAWHIRHQMAISCVGITFNITASFFSLATPMGCDWNQFMKDSERFYALRDCCL